SPCPLVPRRRKKLFLAITESTSDSVIPTLSRLYFDSQSSGRRRSTPAQIITESATRRLTRFIQRIMGSSLRAKPGANYRRDGKERQPQVAAGRRRGEGRATAEHDACFTVEQPTGPRGWA